MTALLIAAPVLSSQQSSVRDVAPAPAGTAVVAGVVLTSDTQPAPVRRARVTLTAEGGTASWSATTNDDGRFAIVNVPTGRHTLEASKAGWLTMAYGASRPGRPGTPITVADGERVPGISIRMSRGGVITGTVIDRTGQPMPGVSVSASRFSFSEQTGERALRRPAGSTDSTTDDQGVFRSYGLPPGEYVIVATLRAGAPTALMDLRPLSDADVDRALRGQAPTPGMPGPLVGFAAVYFPGTADLGQAQSIRLALSEEHAGVTLRLEPVPTARVEAAPVLPPAADPVSLQVYLVSSRIASPMAIGRREADGRYVFGGVTPGPYTLIARAAVAGAATAGPPAPAPAGRGRAGGPPLTLYASVDLTVDGRDLQVPLEVLPGMTVSGRVTFDGDQSRAPVGAISLALMSAREGVSLGVPSTPVDAAGAFRFAGVPPGRYRLAQALGPAAPFQLVSATAGGREVLDTMLDVRAGEDVTDLAVTFSDRVSELSGRLDSADGRAATEYFIVAFASDQRYWTPLSRRVRQVRPATDGRFAIRGLPAGEYLMAALTDVEPGEWYDPAFLTQLVPAAVRVTIRDGEQTVQDLRIK